MSGAVLNSLFLTSGEKDIERVSISGTACELKMLILSISVTFSVTCLTITIAKSCQQRWPMANTFLFILQGNALKDLRYGGRFQGTLGHG